MLINPPVIVAITVRRVATCKPGKPGRPSFSETLALFFIQFLSFRKMKIQNTQNSPSKSFWWICFLHFSFKTLPRRKHRHRRPRKSGAKLEPRPLSYESWLIRKNCLATSLTVVYLKLKMF